MEYLVWAFIILVLVIRFSWTYSNKERNIEVVNQYLGKLKNFTITQSLVNPDFGCGVLLDEVRKEVCVWTFSDIEKQWQEMRLHYNDILSIEIIEDGVSITKTNRTSQIGGALLGGILLGGVGAIIGGLSGKQETSKSKVKNLELKIIINNTSKPIFTIPLLPKTLNEISTSDTKYKEAKANAHHWQAVFEAIIKQADAEEQQSQKNTTVESGSISDELKKLAELKESGILTDDEFVQQKQKLLNR